jgi:pyrrolysyl-tRNA synthetase-like protein
MSKLTEENKPSAKKTKKRYYRKKVNFFLLLKKIKLWPSRTGTLHGIQHFKESGDYAELTTHCNLVFTVRNSRNSRAARWLRNNWYSSPCKQCRVPGWKIEKYSSTAFNRHFGSQLREVAENQSGHDDQDHAD